MRVNHVPKLQAQCALCSLELLWYICVAEPMQPHSTSTDIPQILKTSLVVNVQSSAFISVLLDMLDWQVWIIIANGYLFSFEHEVSYSTDQGLIFLIAWITIVIPNAFGSRVKTLYIGILGAWLKPLGSIYLMGLFLNHVFMSPLLSSTFLVTVLYWTHHAIGSFSHYLPPSTQRFSGQCFFFLWKCSRL